MVVALRTPDGQPHPDGGGGVSSVNGVSNVVLLVNRTAFACRDVASIEASSNKLIKGRFRQEIPCQLLNRKLVEGHILIERLNHPIAVGPHFTVVV